MMEEQATKSRIQFTDLIDGDMLHAHDGIAADGYLQISCKVSAPSDSQIVVNGVEAEYADGIFTADIRLQNGENVLEATDLKSGAKQRITVSFLENFADKYRLSIDDNIWFLRDIHQHEDTYKSLFDNEYLAFLKQVHNTYGTKIHLNIFYQTDGFDLSQLSDKFKKEWKENSDWLRLSFHAKGEFPDQPYISSGYDDVKKDCDLINGHIRRFAGAELMGKVTTVHWGDATVEGSKAMRDSGYTGQLGYFNVDDDQYPASYYLNEDERRHMKKRFVWKDARTGVTFIKTSIVIDTKKLPEIEPHLDAYKNGPGKPPFMDLLVHEQYFYPFYQAYQPDYREKIMTAVKWASDNGYSPAFLSDCI